jgi:hypothetical protein
MVINAWHGNSREAWECTLRATFQALIGTENLLKAKSSCGKIRHPSAENPQAWRS